MRRFFAVPCALAAAIFFPTVSAVAVSAAPEQASDRAYTLSLMCAGVAGRYKNAADELRTMDAVKKMARAKGYSDKRVASDLIEMANVLGAELRENPNAMAENREVCRRLKLIA